MVLPGIPTLDTWIFPIPATKLCFFYYVEENQRDPALNLIYQYMRQEAPGIPLYSIYVKNTLLLFFESHQVSYDRMDSYFRSLSSNVAPALEYRRLSFSNLASLLEQLISKIRRYGTIYFMNGLQPVPICNYRGLISKMEQLTSYLPDESAEMQKTTCRSSGDFWMGSPTLIFFARPDHAR